MTSSPPQIADRRVRRSRKALGDALVALVLEQGYDAVTVEAIIQRADVARATFYAHFTGTGDLLASLIEELARDLTSRILPVAESGPVIRGTAVRELFRHADGHRDLYRVTLSGAGDGRARAVYEKIVAGGAEAVFTNFTTTNSTAPNAPVAAIARAWVGSHLALVDWWLNEHPQFTADEMTEMSMRLVTEGYAWALGMDTIGFDDSLLRA